ncbi:discoidin domain-containing protein [Clostridium estertheticum]|uniref:discoidin domain-containing protein n=1 Tax=Clostridium estertheticum TaxID=238834 RepID=UPI001CF37AFB|nr:discoidin domain-containing protein [Clostridium estertheticum]MCB2358579.1 discoidin domain-containing protein [Clostridium estertheticum]
MDGTNINGLKIEIRDKFNDTISEITGNEAVSIVYAQSYKAGDKICFENSSENKYLIIKIDDELDEALIYLTSNALEFQIPFGEDAKAYSENAFNGIEHNISVRIAKNEEIYSYRDIAKNVIDQRGDTTYYPHSTANVETRNEAVFAARNVIDGQIANKGHGIWPYESWGTWQREDAQIIVNFGREVEVDKIALYLRADFPHDTYWKSLKIEFSDGTSKIVETIKTSDAQYIRFNKKTIRWIKLLDFRKSDELTDFAALTEICVYGNDIQKRQRRP